MTVEVRCAMCGKKIELSKMHKNYEDVKAGKHVHIICENCMIKTTAEVVHQQKKQS